MRTAAWLPTSATHSAPDASRQMPSGTTAPLDSASPQSAAGASAKVAHARRLDRDPSAATSKRRDPHAERLGDQQRRAAVGQLHPVREA
jgi:hypothetical protein